MTAQATTFLKLTLLLLTSVVVSSFPILVRHLERPNRPFPLHTGTIRRKTQVSSTSSAWITSLSTEFDSEAALNELLSSVGPHVPDVAFLFVGAKHAGKFAAIVKRASERLPQTQLMALVGGGIVGEGSEIDQPKLPAMSMLSGVLPAGSKVDLFSFNELSNPPPKDPAFWKDLRMTTTTEGRPPSFMLFVDPWSPIDPILSGLHGSVVAGGISVPINAKPTVAMNGTALPQGSAVAMRFTGTMGIQAIASQGCRPVGPAFTVTKNTANALEELDGVPALQQLQKVTNEASEEDRKLMTAAGYYLVGIGSESSSSAITDFLIRQITGFQPDKGAVVIGARVKTGDRVRFHVRDADAAREDMRLQMKRTQTERMFAGGRFHCGVPVAAVQISCVARGQGMFGSPNVDLSYIGSLFDGDPTKSPVAGFFANGEIGPVGIAGFHEKHVTDGTYMHGFTTVVGLLCDFSTTRSSDSAETLFSTTITSGSFGDVWE
jgi:small ligand-binding sensory domain FIST